MNLEASTSAWLDAPRRARSGLRDLARVCSLAALIDPPFLRRARLTLVKRAGVELEAELWFSPLVERRDHDGIALWRPVLERLRGELRADPPLLRKTWDVLRDSHLHHAPAMRLEERLTWLGLAHGLPTETTGEVITDQTIHDELAQAARAFVAEGGRGIALWARRALPRLPDKSRQVESARFLSAAARVSFGSGPALESGAATADWRRFVQLAEGFDALHVRLLEDRLELAFETLPQATAIEVPRSTPLLLEVSWQHDEARRAVLVGVERGSATELTSVGTRVELRFADGTGVALDREGEQAAAEDEPRPATSRDARYLVERPEVEELGTAVLKARGTLQLTGPRHWGKTHALRLLSDRWRSEGHSVVWVDCAGIPGGQLGGALREAIARDLPLVKEQKRWLRSLRVTAARDIKEMLHAAVDSLRTSGSELLIFVLDDYDGTEEPSLALRTVAQILAADARARAVLARSRRVTGAQVTRLRPFNHRQIMETANRAGLSLRAEDLESIETRTAGDPYLVSLWFDHLLREGSARRAPVAQSPIPETILDHLESLLSNLDSGERRTLRQLLEGRRPKKIPETLFEYALVDPDSLQVRSPLVEDFFRERLREPPAEAVSSSDAEPLFYFSYSFKDGGPQLDRFYDDLCAEVGVRVARREGIGFRDRSTMTGAEWSAPQVEALSRCAAFVAVLSPAYLRSSQCGREWQAFAARLDRDERQPLILPIVWYPLNDVPRAVAEVQYSIPLEDASVARGYERRGLNYLAKRAGRDAYQQIVEALAKRLVAVTAQHPLRAGPIPTFSELPDAFAKRPGPASRTRPMIQGPAREGKPAKPAPEKPALKQKGPRKKQDGWLIAPRAGPRAKKSATGTKAGRKKRK